MSEEYREQQVNRRGFLKAAAATTVAATATGAGVAMLRSRESLPVNTVAVPPVAQTIVTVNNQATDLLAQLASAQAENVRLQADLAAVRRRLESQLQTTDDTDGTVQAMSLELESANSRVGLLSGLIALYEQLDDVDVADLLEDGMNVVATAIADVTDDLPSLSDGVAFGRQALAELDDHIPLLESGRNWLADQSEKMQLYFNAVESLLETVVERAGPFLQMFNEWVQNILKWLPFGLGQRTSSVMDGITTLLLETPHTISGLHTNVAQPMDVWLAGSGDDLPLRKKVIKPIQEQVLVKAEQVTSKTAHVESVFNERIAAPGATAVANRRQIRSLITDYRQQHQI